MSIFSALDSFLAQKRLDKQLYQITAAGLEPFEGYDPSSLSSLELNACVRSAGNQLALHMLYKAQFEQLTDRTRYYAGPWARKVTTEMIAIQQLLLNRTNIGEPYALELHNEAGQLILMLAALLGRTPDAMRQDSAVRSDLARLGFAEHAR